MTFVLQNVAQFLFLFLNIGWIKKKRMHLIKARNGLLQINIDCI